MRRPALDMINKVRVEALECLRGSMIIPFLVQVQILFITFLLATAKNLKSLQIWFHLPPWPFGRASASDLHPRKRTKSVIITEKRCEWKWIFTHVWMNEWQLKAGKGKSVISFIQWDQPGREQFSRRHNPGFEFEAWLDQHDVHPVREDTQTRQKREDSRGSKGMWLLCT